MSKVEVEATPAADHAAHEMGHGGGMCTEAIACDMHKRFWIALIFSIPIFVYSPVDESMLTGESMPVVVKSLMAVMMRN